jgi:hypothetical protein
LGLTGSSAILLTRPHNTRKYFRFQCPLWLDEVDALSDVLDASSPFLLLDLIPSDFLGPEALAADCCSPPLWGSPPLLGCVFCFAPARSTASAVFRCIMFRSTGRSTRMPLVHEVNSHLGVARKSVMAGPCWTLLAGSHDGFHTTSSSLSPVSDVRSAKMSCTSHKGSPLCVGFRFPGMRCLSIAAAAGVLLPIVDSACESHGCCCDGKSIRWCSRMLEKPTAADVKLL